MEKEVLSLLHHTSHRPFPLPQKKWTLYQEWKDVIFIHTKVEQELAASLIPPGLELDLVEGKAWLSFVIFHTPVSMLRTLPGMKVLPSFCELNLRTYVTRNGMPGIHFIHIKANKHLPVLTNKLFSLLPYQYAPIRCSNMNRRYFMNEGTGRNLVDVDFLPDKKIMNKSYLDKWLTERYVAWQASGKSLYSYYIHHDAWDLYSVKPRYQVVRYQQPQLLLNHADDLFIHFSPLQKALLWQRERAD
jgi:uncharacterized protein